MTYRKFKVATVVNTLFWLVIILAIGLKFHP